MIGKGHAISGTRVSISYGWNQEKEAEVVLREHVAGDTPAEIAEECLFQLKSIPLFHFKSIPF
jgi:hypothetical protein